MPAEGRLGRADLGWLNRVVVGDANEQRLERARRFATLARELDVAPAALAIAWCLRNPLVSSVILGASRPDQLLQNLQALELVDRIDEAGWRRIEASAA